MCHPLEMEDHRMFHCRDSYFYVKVLNRPPTSTSIFLELGGGWHVVGGPCLAANERLRMDTLLLDGILADYAPLAHAVPNGHPIEWLGGRHWDLQKGWRRSLLGSRPLLLYIETKGTQKRKIKVYTSSCSASSCRVHLAGSPYTIGISHPGNPILGTPVRGPLLGLSLRGRPTSHFGKLMKGGSQWDVTV